MEATQPTSNQTSCTAFKLLLLSCVVIVVVVGLMIDTKLLDVAACKRKKISTTYIQKSTAQFLLTYHTALSIISAIYLCIMY